MTFSEDVDAEKASMLLAHLSKASGRVKDKDIAKERLQEQVEKLRKQSMSKSYRKDLKELERRLADVLEKEQEILRHQKARAAATRKVKEKISEVEERLTRYIDTKRVRDRRIRELEEKIKKRFSAEQQQIEMLSEQLQSLEKLYSRISGEKRYSKSQLEKVKKKIGSLKSRLSKVK